MSYHSGNINIDNLDVEKLLAESRRTRLGYEGSSYVPQYQPTVIESTKHEEYTHPPTQYISSSYNYTPTNYSYQPQPEVKISSSYTYQPHPEEKHIHEHHEHHEHGHSETVKRAGIASGGPSSNSLQNRQLIIMLGAEIERMLDIGRDVEYRYSQLTIEITQIRETLSIKEREIYDYRDKNNTAELRRILEEKEMELKLLRSNPGNDAHVNNPELEASRKKLKKLEYDEAELKRLSADLSAQITRIQDELGKGKKSRTVVNKKHSTAWCC